MSEQATSEERCPKCGAGRRDTEQGHQQFACSAWVHVRTGRYFASQKCLERQLDSLTAANAQLQAEVGRLRPLKNAALAYAEAAKAYESPSEEMGPFVHAYARLRELRDAAKQFAALALTPQ